MTPGGGFTLLCSTNVSPLPPIFTTYKVSANTILNRSVTLTAPCRCTAAFTYSWHYSIITLLQRHSEAPTGLFGISQPILSKQILYLLYCIFLGRELKLLLNDLNVSYTAPCCWEFLTCVTTKNLPLFWHIRPPFIMRPPAVFSQLVYQYTFSPS